MQDRNVQRRAPHPGTLPCITLEGKLILGSKHQLARNPNGNGGVYDGSASCHISPLLVSHAGDAALARSGALDDMRRRGVEYIHCSSVDNVLLKVPHATGRPAPLTLRACSQIGDPTFVGFFASSGSDCSNKVVYKVKRLRRALADPATTAPSLRSAIPTSLLASCASAMDSPLWLSTGAVSTRTEASPAMRAGAQRNFEGYG